MTIYEGLTLGFIIMGIIFIILGFAVNKTRSKVSEDEEAMEDEAFRKQMNLINEKVLELGDYHNFIKDEIEAKHKELLFLYQMISEKEKTIRKMQGHIDQQQGDLMKVDDLAVAPGPVTSNSNKKIIDLRENGYEAKEIAQILNIGIGEVNLVLNLYD